MARTKVRRDLSITHASRTRGKPWASSYCSRIAAPRGPPRWPLMTGIAVEHGLDLPQQRRILGEPRPGLVQHGPLLGFGLGSATCPRSAGRSRSPPGAWPRDPPSGLGLDALELLPGALELGAHLGADGLGGQPRGHRPVEGRHGHGPMLVQVQGHDPRGGRGAGHVGRRRRGPPGAGAGSGH